MEKRMLIDWLDVRGQEFTPDEARQAADFADTVSNYHILPEELKDFIQEREMKVGHRLFLSEYMPIEDMGVLLLAEEDDRIIKIAKDRCGENNEEESTQGGIYIPGSSNSGGGIIWK
jgi:hypothetical protein